MFNKHESIWTIWIQIKFYMNKNYSPWNGPYSMLYHVQCTHALCNMHIFEFVFDRSDNSKFLRLLNRSNGREMKCHVNYDLILLLLHENHYQRRMKSSSAKIFSTFWFYVFEIIPEFFFWRGKLPIVFQRRSIFLFFLH